MQNQPIAVTLIQNQLWAEFYQTKNEMIVSKKGRSIFPKLYFTVSGLVPDILYTMGVHFECVDNIKYKFDKGVWLESSRAESAVQPKVVRHPDGMKSGEQWMGVPLRFDSLKITNNISSNEPSHCVVQSMHKYRPVLTIYQMGQDSYTMVPIQEFRFAVAEFIAVTAYQNNAVSKLKIAKNKYARGFREENSRKRAAAKMEKENSSSPQDRLFENAAKRAPCSVPQYYPGYNMPYNDMANFYCPQQQLPNYHHYPMAAPMYQPMDGQQMVYNPAAYWPQMVQPTMHQPYAATPNHSDSYQSISPEMTNHSI